MDCIKVDSLHSRPLKKLVLVHNVVIFEHLVYKHVLFSSRGLLVLLIIDFKFLLQLLSALTTNAVVDLKFGGSALA